MRPMLTRASLVAHARAAPAFGEFARRFKVHETYDGVNVFAPVLGNPNVSVMRELHDTERALRLVARQEGARGWRYHTLVFSRLEYRWVAPHPPLSVLESGLVWVPSGQNIKGVNDRHAVMPRSAAPAFYNRWSLLKSSKLMQVVAVDALTHIGPEELLLHALEYNLGGTRLRVGFFPSVMLLDCCPAGPAARCFNNECHGFWSAASCASAACLAEAAQAGNAPSVCEGMPAEKRPSPTAPLLAGALAASARRGQCHLVRGKYFGEIIDAVRHWQWMQCGPKYRYMRLEPKLEGPWGAPPTVALVVAAGRWLPDPSAASRTRFVHLDHALRFVPSAAGFGCPLLDAPRHLPSEVPTHGFCDMTPDSSDCERGSLGMWSTRPKRKKPFTIANLSACIERCHGCARCNYVSYSLLNHDCSWYNKCRVQSYAGPVAGLPLEEALRRLRGERARGALELATELRLLRHVVDGFDYVTASVVKQRA